MKKLKFISSVILCILLLTGCSKGSTVPTDSTKALHTDSVSSSADSLSSSADDLESLINYDNATKINLDLNEPEISGVSIKDSVYTINKGGTYIITGTLNPGQLVVNADKQDVWIVMDSARIICNDSSPLYIEDAKDTYLILKDGSENALTDGSEYKTSAEEDPDATLFCKNDLIIGGSGSLSIDSNHSNALHTKDTLTIRGGNLTIDSVDTGIKAKDGLEILGGSINVTCEGDGIQTTNSEEPDKGNINITSGTVTVVSQKDAIQSENAMTISGGSFDIITGEGAENADYKYDSPMDFWGGYEDNTSDVSMKALKAQNTLTITSGRFKINSEDDSIHSNTAVTINGGIFNISSGDDGIHADSVTTIDSGEITVTASYEGIEGSEININGGTIHINASDDGINSAGGGDTGYGGFGPDSFSSSSSYMLTINGGYLYVNSGGDGLDSNGSISVTGGTSIINGPASSGNSPFDWERECIISGGTFIGAGSAEMMENVSSASTQCCIGVNFGYSFTGNTICTVTDGSDFSLSFAPAKNFSYFFVSTPDLAQGKEYSIYTGGTHSGTAADGLYTQGEFSSGELFTTLTTDSNVTVYGSSFGGMGPGGMGGMPPNRRGM